MRHHFPRVFFILLVFSLLSCQSERPKFDCACEQTGLAPEIAALIDSTYQQRIGTLMLFLSHDSTRSPEAYLVETSSLRLIKSRNPFACTKTKKNFVFLYYNQEDIFAENGVIQATADSIFKHLRIPSDIADETYDPGKPDFKVIRFDNARKPHIERTTYAPLWGKPPLPYPKVMTMDTAL